MNPFWSEVNVCRKPKFKALMKQRKQSQKTMHYSPLLISPAGYKMLIELSLM